MAPIRPEEITARYKAAVIVAQLGPEVAKPVFAEMQAEEIQELASEVARLKEVDPALALEMLLAKCCDPLNQRFSPRFLPRWTQRHIITSIIFKDIFLNMIILMIWMGECIYSTSYFDTHSGLNDIINSSI